MFQINAAPLTDTGRKRHHNEDWTVQFEPQSLEERTQSGCLYIVADGVGGAALGERASQYASQKVLYEYYHNPETPPAERLGQAMRQAGNEIYQYAEEQGQGRMATTMVAAVILGDKLIVANVGDSRAYLLRDGVAHQITRDHSLVGEMIRDGSMTEEESLHSKVKNSLTRSLGGERDTQVDLFELDLQTGDRLLLSTDGLLRYATRREITAMLSSGTPREAAEQMVNYALEQGGADNITVLPIEIGPLMEEGSTIMQRGELASEPAEWELMTTEPIAPSSSITLPAARRTRRKQYTLLYGLFGGAALLTLVAVFIFIIWRPKPETNQIAELTPASAGTVIPTGAIDTVLAAAAVTSTDTPTITPTNTETSTHTPEATVTYTSIPTSTEEPLVRCIYKVEEDKIKEEYNEEFSEQCNYEQGIGWLDVSCIARIILNKQIDSNDIESYLATVTCADAQPCSYTTGTYNAFDGDVLVFPEIYQNDCNKAGGNVYDGTE